MFRFIRILAVCLSTDVARCMVIQFRGEEVKPNSVYVTFVSGSSYWKYAFVLTSTLRELGHALPHVYMVKAGSPEAQIAPRIQQVADQHGLRITFETYQPITVPWKTSYNFWDEAWQRVVLYNMSKFTRMLHLDADIVAYGDIEHILADGAMPSAARRMGSCDGKANMCTSVPVSNVMLIEPDAKIAAKIGEWLQDPNGRGDETRQFELHRNLTRLSPSEVLYSDCFKKEDASAQLKEWGFSAGTRMPAAVHLGIPFKGLVSSASVNSAVEAASLVARERQEGNPWFAALLERWYGHLHSERVQALMAQVGEGAADTRRVFEDAGRDLCD